LRIEEQKKETKLIWCRYFFIQAEEENRRWATYIRRQYWSIQAIAYKSYTCKLELGEHNCQQQMGKALC